MIYTRPKLAAKPPPPLPPPPPPTNTRIDTKIPMSYAHRFWVSHHHAIFHEYLAIFKMYHFYFQTLQSNLRFYWLKDLFQSLDGDTFWWCLIRNAQLHLLDKYLSTFLDDGRSGRGKDIHPEKNGGRPNYFTLQITFSPTPNFNPGKHSPHRWGHGNLP